MARNRARSESDVDIVSVFEDNLRNGEPVDLFERESWLVLTLCLTRQGPFANIVGLAAACGREVFWLCIWQGHDWAW